MKTVAGRFNQLQLNISKMQACVPFRLDIQKIVKCAAKGKSSAHTFLDKQASS